MNRTVASVYASTLDAGDEAKNSFYDDRLGVINIAPTGVLLIVVKDWNARPCPANMATRHILGKLALGSKCAKGDRLANCA